MSTTKIHYEVRGLFWKEQLQQEKPKIKAFFDYKKDKLCSITKAFSGIDPYKAREEAFLFYQSIIDVLYEALGKPYSDDHQARSDLQVFLHAGRASVTRIGNMCFDDNLFNEIAVYWVCETDGKCKRRLIHGIGYCPEDEPEQAAEQLMATWFNLIAEREYYESNDLNLPSTILCDMTDIGGDYDFVPPTPFNWDLFSGQHCGQDLFGWYRKRNGCTN